MENWKDIKGYEGKYQVSDCGKIKSLARDKFLPNGTFHSHLEEKILVQRINRYGYPCVHLYKNRKMKNMVVHRLVAMAFLPNPENKPQINHRDEVKNNNVVENLEWCEASYNNIYGTRIERMLQNRKSYKLGDSPSAKPVFCEELNKTFDCAKRVEEELGIWGTSIGKACRGERNTAGGFHWRYADEND